MNFAGRSSFSRQSFVQQETKWAAGPSNLEESSFRHRQPLWQFVNNFEISGNLLYFSAIASTMLCKSVEKEKRPSPRVKGASVHMSRAVRYKKHLTTLQVFLSIVLILLTACVAVKAFFLKAPEQKVDELPSQPSSTGDPQLSEEEQAAQEALRSHLERKGGFYTILVSGSDDGNGNSDTNILVAVDTVNGYVYGVSIPRDSKAVWDGKSHKINAAFGKGGMTKLAEVVSDQLGIPVDYTVSVDLTGFEALVEAIGGVNFDVPINMDYDDPIQNLSIHFKKGVQYLNGADAMRVVRFRHNNDGTGYGSEDLGRMQTQQKFLKAVAKKMLSFENLISNPRKYAEIFGQYVDTDLSVTDLAWFGMQVLGMGVDKIDFSTLPNEWKYPYIYLDPDETLALVNTYLNPYVEDRTAEDLNLPG